jgi:hypothetical protein
MATMFVRHTVSNYKTWRKAYDDFASVQKAKGVTCRFRKLHPGGLAQWCGISA